MRRTASLTLSVLVFCAGAAVAQEPASPANASSPVSSPVPASGRLKFKGRGPVCVCSSGLSERDIEQAAKRRADAGTEPTDQPTTGGASK